MFKAKLRHQLLKKRAQNVANSLPLIEGICGYIQHHSIEQVAAYVPTETEPGGGIQLIDALASATATLYLPAVRPAHQMHWGIYESRGKLVEGRYGILEPKNPRFTSAILESCGLVLVPGLACTRSGIRLGRGGGFYDRALATISRERVRFGVALNPWEILDEIPFEQHDIVMDVIFTAEGTYQCSSNV